MDRDAQNAAASKAADEEISLPTYEDLKLKTACCCCSLSLFNKQPTSCAALIGCCCFSTGFHANCFKKQRACCFCEGMCSLCDAGEDGNSKDCFSCAPKCTICCCSEGHFKTECDLTKCTACKDICQCCCLDCRFVLPPDADAPFEIACCGKFAKKRKDPAQPAGTVTPTATKKGQL